MRILVVCENRALAEPLEQALVHSTLEFATHTVSNLDNLESTLPLTGWDALVFCVDTASQARAKLGELFTQLQGPTPVWIVLDEWNPATSIEAVRAGMAGCISSADLKLLPALLLRATLQLGFAGQSPKLPEEYASCHLFMNSVINTLPYEIVVRDGDSRILFANNNFAAVYGRHPDELIGLLDRDMWSECGRPPEQIAEWLAEDQAILNSNQDKDYLQEIQRSSGEVVYIHNIKKVITLADGTRCIMGMYTDVTERKRIEDELIKTRNQAAELAGIRKTTATYAHEINNPLTGIIGSVQLILEEELDSETRMLLKEVLKASHRIKDVISRMSQLVEHASRPYLDKSEIIDLRKPSK